jgi:hypothetical protein
MTRDRIIANLKRYTAAQTVRGRVRRGVRPALAGTLWDSGIYEGRGLISMVFLLIRGNTA